MPELPRRVALFAAEHRLWSAGATLLVAVSGGPDSLALLHLLRRLAPMERLTLYVAHLDHNLRPDSAADARFVADLAAEWGLPIVQGSRDVAALRTTYGGVEAAARAARYGFLRATALAIGAHAVVTGHNADDQAETVLLRLLRGAGPSGLGAMRPRLDYRQWCAIGPEGQPDDETGSPTRPALVRPLLATPRGVIETYCVDQGLAPRLDPTNQSSAHLRNRVRGYIIPFLKTYNSNIVGGLGRTARVCAEEDAFIAEALDRAWPALATVAHGLIVMRRTAFADLHRALQRRALRRAVAQVAPDVELGADHLERMLTLVERPHGRLQLPGGVWMKATRDLLMVERTTGR